MTLFHKMSLIQVSSTQKMFMEEDGLNSKGYKFTNHFQSVLKIPPNSKIALDNALFQMSTQNLIPLSSLSTSDKKHPYMKLLFADTDSRFYEEMTTEDNTKRSTMIPFPYPLPKADYESIDDFWGEMVKFLSLDPRPALYKSLTTNQTIQSGGIFQQNIVSNFKTQLSTHGLKMDQSYLFNEDNHWTPGGTNEYNEFTYNINSQKYAQMEKMLFSRFTGISNMNGTLEGKLRTKANTYIDDDGNYNSLRRAIFGINRWIDEGSNSYNARNEWLHNKLTIMSDSEYEDLYDTKPYLRPYLLSRFLTETNALGEQACDYFFCVLQSSYFDDGRKTLSFLKSIPDTKNDKQRVSICKLEKSDKISNSATDFYDEDDKVRLVMIATGDEVISTNFGVPYSAYLDPTNNGFVNPPVAYESRWLWNNGDNNDGLSNMKIKLEGNKVSFEMNGNTIKACRDFEDWDTENKRHDVYDYIDDKVFPLQFAFGLSRSGDRVSNVQFTTTCSDVNEQEVVKDVSTIGEKESDRIYSFYKENKMIPASILCNRFQDPFGTPTNFYPLKDGATAQFFPDEREPQPDFINLNGYIQRKPFLVLGASPKFDVPGVNDYIKANVELLLDFKSLVGVTNSYIPVTAEANWNKTTSTYNLTFVTDPFINGIHVLVKDLPNDSTMGSINQANSSKLVAVINDYKKLTNDEILESQVYAYNKNERLYIDLHNPSTIETSHLSFELVDRLGNYLTSIVNTLLTFHLKSGKS